MDKVSYNGKIAICTPFYNMQACSEYVTSLVQTSRILEKLGIEFDVYSVNDSYVGRARNSLCGRFLESDCTDLFFIDSDEDWDIFGFFRVLMSPFDVVGASYKMKNNWDNWTAQLKLKEERPIGLVTGEDTAILESNFIPCGFMRIKRAALEKFRDEYPALKYQDQGKEYTSFFECSIQDGNFTGEDVTFCRRWQDIGGQVWVEPNVTITHYGMKGWQGNLDKHLRGGHA